MIWIFYWIFAFIWNITIFIYSDKIIYYNSKTGENIVLPEDLKKEWTKYIRENKIADWTNVYQTKEMEAAIADSKKPGFRQLYDIKVTPTIYLLDKEKRIIGKKLTIEQLHELLQVKWAPKPKQ